MPLINSYNNKGLYHLHFKDKERKVVSSMYGSQ